MPDSTAFPKTRYYQDAAIRAAFEKILQCEQGGKPARVLLSLATGSGKTVIAANLLWRMHEAGRLNKPALFLCDRDELREQAYDKLAKAFPKGSVRIVETERGKNAAKNAKVHIATYQTLGLEDTDHQYASFLSEHYPPDSFSVIVIDECHRSAWGQWSEVLKRNQSAIHIGLTATPRKLHESQQRTKEDVEITSNNLTYFGEPVYEYTLIEAQEDGYLAACEIVRLKPSIDWKTFTREEVVAAKPKDARTGLPVREENLNEKYTTLKRAKASEANIESCRAELALVEKAQREAQAKADAIDATTFDLKAVNPRARVIRDTRSVGEVLESIEQHGKTVQEALATLRKQLDYRV